MMLTSKLGRAAATRARLMRTISPAVLYSATSAISVSFNPRFSTHT
jgi:hypothetical protein